MIIKFFLLSMLTLLSIYALSQQKSSPTVSGMMLAISAIGIFFVAFPEASNKLANFAGVGRGADLVFYSFIVFTLVTIFHLHLRMRMYSETMTELARSLALLSTRRPQSE